MASRAFFDPITFLRLAPAVSATCSLLFAADQQLFLSILTRPENRATSNKLLPSYFSTLFNRGIFIVVGFLSLTFWTSFANLRLYRPLLEAKGSYPWYAAAAGLAIGHLGYIPLVAPKVRAIKEDSSQGNSADDMDAWLRVNALRSCTTDIGAWVCAIIAVVKTFSP
ncbi:hypothetical protein GQ53DRAFT_35003 [Thozetella sp. PMI_491]|nr:hypothetical protein GQ53DRAFT_35003 [Thozetella sp. PMI_491]